MLLLYCQTLRETTAGNCNISKHTLRLREMSNEVVLRKVFLLIWMGVQNLNVRVASFMP